MRKDAIEMEANRLVDSYADMIRRICYSYLHSVADAQDICQDVLLKRLTSQATFDSSDHEKAWIVRVTLNACKDHVKRADYLRLVPLQEGIEIADTREEINLETQDVMSAIDALPQRYRVSIYLRYYEGYSSKEIAEITNQSVAAVDKQLSRGRALLKTQLEGDYA